MYFSRGPGTLKLTPKLFAENRNRLVNSLRTKCKKGTAVLLQGGSHQERYNIDSTDYVFRQESYFFWAFGVHEPDFYGAIDIDTGRSILFAPKLDPDYEIWHGRIESAEWFRTKYEVDEVHISDENTVAETLKKMGFHHLLLLRAENTDSGNVLPPARFKGSNFFTLDTETLYPIITNLRVFKTDSELEVMRYACKVSADAHRAAMSVAKPGMYQYQMESGADCAILDYGHANAPNYHKMNDGDMCLFDCGCEYNCYASDITTSFPVNGKFTEKQKGIYNAVLHANHAVFENAKPGVRWTDMHLLAEKTMLSDLKNIGLLKGDVDEMVKARIGAVFMPHGLGHFIGLDDHDVGGYLGDATPRSTEPGLKCLRTTRTLQERIVISIEPGCYFIDTVRIEDDVIIWAHGNERMTNVPRTVNEIELFMKTNKQ
ncbi:unnamed protein product [Anisakis simplex]|uniref:Xaa-Pro dipeptidase n=1 Tax=Anisakis simplex TaxID=6269 RepID=A0A0M3K810_ANISI|nr:unnamed protein product [Anisakis simplex]